MSEISIIFCSKTVDDVAPVTLNPQPVLGVEPVPVPFNSHDLKKQLSMLPLAMLAPKTPVAVPPLAGYAVLLMKKLEARSLTDLVRTAEMLGIERMS